MAAVLLPSAMFVALLLSLSPPGAGADDVTWRKCKRVDDDRGRVLEETSDKKATCLDLSVCNLTDVKPGDFYGLPNVDTLWLMQNHIAQVELVAFSDTPKLMVLNLGYNEMHEAPVFDEHSFCPSLVNLYLLNNRITELRHPKTFSGCVELEYISLRDNFIEYIHPDIFSPLSKLRTLTIDNNRLTTIPENLLTQNVKLNSLSLYKNKFSFLPSNFVSKLKTAGAPLRGINFFFSDNPWHCACLLELLAELKSAGVWETGSDVRYRGTRPSCVYYGAYPCRRKVPTGLLGRAEKQPLALASAAP